MPIEVRLDRLLVKHGISVTELAERVRISVNNLSRLKTNKVKGVRFETLGSICRELTCQPGDVLVRRERKIEISEGEGEP